MSTIIVARDSIAGLRLEYIRGFRPPWRLVDTTTGTVVARFFDEERMAALAEYRAVCRELRAGAADFGGGFRP